MQKNKNTQKQGGGIKKILLGIISIIFVALIIFSISWIQRSADKFQVKGQVTDVNMEGKNIVVHEVKIIEDENGEYQSNEKYFTVTWDENTEFITEKDYEVPRNKILSNLARVEVSAEEQLSDSAMLATKIKLTQESPPLEL